MAPASQRLLACVAAPLGVAWPGAPGKVGGPLNTPQGLELSLQQIFSGSKLHTAEFAKGIEEIVSETCAFWNVTGCSVGVSFNGSETFANFGVSNKETGAAVDADTLFQIGSTTKAYTTMAILQRVVKGELDLDVPVTTYLPEFNLSAAGATGLTLRDMLSHRTGLPRHDALYFMLPDSRTEEARKDLVRRLHGLALDKPVRYAFEYNNHMILAAGLAAGAGHKDGWEGLVKDEVLSPLNMTDTWLHATDLDASARSRFATPYQNGAACEVMPTELIGPAGSIVSSTTEQLKWLTAHMAQLRGEAPLLDTAAFAQLMQPNAIAPLLNHPFGTYTLTWWLEQLTSDIWLMHHGGNTNGFTAHNVVVLRANSHIFGARGPPLEPLAAISILTNQGASTAPIMLLLQITSFLAKLPLISDLNQRQYEALAPVREQQAEAERQFDKMVEEGKKQPSQFTAQEVVGLYEHVSYGRIAVTGSKNNLTATPNGLKPYPLVHLWNDTFGLMVSPSDIAGFVFVGKGGGPAAAMAATLEPTVPAIVFDRVPVAIV